MKKASTISDDLRPRILVCDDGAEKPRYNAVQLQLNQLLKMGDLKNPNPDFFHDAKEVTAFLNWPLRDSNDKPYDVVIVSYPWLVSTGLVKNNDPDSLSGFLEKIDDLTKKVLILDLVDNESGNLHLRLNKGKTAFRSKKSFFEDIGQRFDFKIKDFVPI